MNKGSSGIKQIVVIAIIVLLGLIAFFMFPDTVLTLDGMLKKGENYQKTGRDALALKVYKKATEMYPASYEAHLHLGNAYLEVDEPELAKQEFDKAVELSGNSQNKFDAQIAMATMLLADNNYKKAEELLLSVDDPKPDKVKLKLAELYLAWGDKELAENNRSDAVKKYKMAFKNYDSVDVEAQQKVEDKAIKTYMDIANYYLTQKKVNQAIETLKNSVEFVDNPSAHIKLAEIYRKQNKRDEAIAEYEKAYDLDTTGTAALYLGDLLVEKGVELAKKNNMKEAKICFEKAQEANPSIIIPAEILYSISIDKIKTSLTPNTVSDKIFPRVSFVISNKSKESIDFLKVQAVFLDAGKIVGKTEKIIVSDRKPLAAGKSTRTITLSSPVGVEGLKKPHMIQAKVYMVYGDHHDWKFARTITLSRKKKLFTVKKPAGSSSSKPAKVVNKPKIQTDDKDTSLTSTNSINSNAANSLSVPEVKPHIPDIPAVPQPVPIPVNLEPTQNNAVPQQPSGDFSDN